MSGFYYKKSRLNQLRGFVTTVQNNCSARQAAEKIGVEPATIGKQIASLEEALGIQLFIRTPNHRLKITEYGNDFYNMAVERLQFIDELFNDFSNKIEGEQKHSVNIAAHSIAISHVLPQYIKTYKELNNAEKIEFNLANLELKTAEEGLLNNDLDFALYPIETLAKQKPEFDVIPVFKYKPVFICTKENPLSKIEDHKLTLKDIAKYDFLHVDRFVVLDSFKAMMKNYHMKTSINLRNGNWEILKQMVKNGLGVTIFGGIYLDQYDFNDMCVKYVEHLLPEMVYALIIKKGKILSEAANDFIELLRNSSDI